MATLLKRLKALYLPFAYIIVSIVAVPIIAFEAIEAAEFIIARVEPPTPALPTPSSVTQAPATTATTPVDADPTCEIGDTIRNELCAQWRAADAATSAVHIGWGQLGVSIITLLAAGAAAVYAKRAAGAAASANAIATNTERPWLFFEASLKGTISFPNEKMVLPIEIDFRNVGNTPAIDIYVEWDAFQTLSPDLEAEYKRILASPKHSERVHIEPIRDKDHLGRNQYVSLDRRDESAQTVVAIIVYYRGPHSRAQYHTLTFYYPDSPRSAGQADQFHKAANGTRIV